MLVVFILIFGFVVCWFSIFFLLSREMAHAYGLIRFHWIFRFGAIERDEIFRQIVFLVFILDCYVVDVRLIFYFILICECFFIIRKIRRQNNIDHSVQQRQRPKSKSPSIEWFFLMLCDWYGLVFGFWFGSVRFSSSFV